MFRKRHRTKIPQGLGRVLPAALAAALPVTAAGQSIDLGGLGHPVGSPEAPVQVVEFSDPSCPHCKEFHEEAYPTLHAGYVDTGLVRWVFVPLVTGQYPNSVAAGAALECAGELGRFATAQGKLYEEQDAWMEAPPDAAAELIRGYGLAENGDMTAFTECLTSEGVAARLNQSGALAAAVGVSGVPTYVIDGFPVTGALPAEVIGQILDARLKQLGIGAPD